MMSIADLVFVWLNQHLIFLGEVKNFAT